VFLNEAFIDFSYANAGYVVDFLEFLGLYLVVKEKDRLLLDDETWEAVKKLRGTANDARGALAAAAGRETTG